MNKNQQNACRIAKEVLDILRVSVKAGMSTLEVDLMAKTLIEDRKGKSGTFNYGGFPGNLCVSINNEACHGYGKPDVFIRNGDIVKLDCVVKYRGWYGDSAITIGIGKISNKLEELIAFNKSMLDQTLKQINAGMPVHEIGGILEDFIAIQEKVYGDDFDLIYNLYGHGIGREIHKLPTIKPYKDLENNYVLQVGDVVCIEPLLTTGDGHALIKDEDGYTLRTSPDDIATHFEHTVEVLEDGVKIWT